MRESCERCFLQGMRVVYPELDGTVPQSEEELEECLCLSVLKEKVRGKRFVILVGEAPGYVENEKGRPFVGDSGTFLREIIDEVVAEGKEGRKGREKFFIVITNVCKCLPEREDGSGVRPPSREEIECCLEAYLGREFLVYGEAAEGAEDVCVVLLGKTAVTGFVYLTGGFFEEEEREDRGVVFGKKEVEKGFKLGDLRERNFYVYLGKKKARVIVTYHPAARFSSKEEKKEILRKDLFRAFFPEREREVWEEELRALVERNRKGEEEEKEVELVVTMEKLEELISFFKEPGEKEPIFFDFGFLFKVQKERFGFLRYFSSVEKGGFVPGGFFWFGISAGGEKVWAVPVLLDSVVEEYSSVFQRFITEYERKGFDLVRGAVQAKDLFELFFLRDVGFSYDFVKEVKDDLEKNPALIEFRFSRALTCVQSGVDVLSAISSTVFHAFSRKVDWKRFLECFRGRRIVVEDEASSVKFLGVLKRAGIDISSGWDLFPLPSAEKKEEKKREITLYSGSEGDYEAALKKRVVQGIEKLEEKYRMFLEGLEKGRREKVVVPYYEKRLGGFGEVSLSQAERFNMVFRGRVVSPLLAESCVSGVGVDVQKIEKAAEVLREGLERIEEFVQEKSGKSMDELEKKIQRKWEKDVEKAKERVKGEGLEFFSEVDVWDEGKRFCIFSVLGKRKIEGILRLIQELYFWIFANGRIYPGYDGTVTGRVVTKNPAVFRVSAEGGFSLCRKCGGVFFRKGRCLVCGEDERKAERVEFDGIFRERGYFDLSQAEISFIAFLSGDRQLFEVMRSGGDFYAKVGAFYLGVPYEEVIEGIRKGDERAKKIREFGKRKAFGLVYGCKFSDWKVKEFRSLYAWFWGCEKEVKERCEKEGRVVVSTISGRVRELTCSSSRSVRGVLRKFVNTAGQGGFADVFFLLLQRLKREAGKRGIRLEYHFFNQDGVYFSWKEKEKNERDVEDVEKAEGFIREFFVGDEVRRVMRDFVRAFFRRRDLRGNGLAFKVKVKIS